MIKFWMVTAFLFITISGISQFKPNTIGVVYLHEEERDAYYVTIVIPKAALENQTLKVNDSILYTGVFTFFDAKGEIADISLPEKRKKDMIVKNVCETEDLQMVQMNRLLLKVFFSRPLIKNQELKGATCFVLLNRKPQKLPVPNNPVAGGVRLRGDYNADGKPDCSIWTCYSKDNCDVGDEKLLDINLQIGSVYYPLHCCKP